jgi:heme/copper-type cytochrome/quinol oxidase subunit 2
MPKFRLLAAAFAPTYVSTAGCYAQGHLVSPPLSLPPHHVRLLFLLLLLILLIIIIIIIIYCY